MNTHFDLEPVPFTGVTRFIGGRELTEVERASGCFLGEITGLPVRETGVGYISRWTCKSLYWRFVFLFTGKINLNVSGGSHPPCAIWIGEPR